MGNPPQSWNESAFAPPLGRGEVHIWHVRLGQVSPQMWGLLSEEEQARAQHFHFARDRDRFATCRAKLRQFLAQYCGASAGGLIFDYGPFGKPSLRRQAGQESLHFNVSHSGDAALLAFSRGVQVGVDVERLKMTLDFPALARRFMVPGEAAFICSAADVARAFHVCWTRKEAWMKAVGCGLSEEPERFDVSASFGQAITHLTRADQGGSAWTLYDLAPGPDLIGAVVVEGRGADVRCLREAPTQGPH
jgi:4'-phosphopantetheinyl transferase